MALPSGYKQLAYVKSTGTQYVNTGVIPTTNTRVVIEFEWISPPTNVSTWHTVFGSRTSSGSGDQFNITTDSGNSYAGFASQEITVTQPYNKANTRYVVDISKNGVIVNGVNAGTFNSGLNVVSSYPMYVFGRNNAGTFGNGMTGKVMSMKIYNGTTLIRDYIPCKNASGTVGLWDDVNSVFYGNAGSGSFVAGELPKAHKTLVGGTAHEIKSGRCLINATGHKIKKGRTLIDGTGYDIKFTDHTVTVRVPSTVAYNEEYTKVWIDGVQLYDGDVVEVADGEILSCFVKANAGVSNGAAYVYVNEAYWEGVSAYDNPPYATFEYPITCDITVLIYGTTRGRVSIFEEGHEVVEPT